MKVIKLADHSTLEFNVNFLTIKMLTDQGLTDANFTSEDPKVQIDIASRLLYVLLYSNGKKLTMEDALALIPLGEEDTLLDLIDEFKTRMEIFQKKTASRAQLNEQLMK